MKNKNMNTDSNFEEKHFYHSPFEMYEVLPPAFLDRTIEVENTGNAKTIQEAIHTCAALGGGTIIVPSGKWVSSGSIHLRSNIRLLFQNGVEIEFSKNFSDYLPVVFTRWEGIECYNYSPLIYAKDCENIAIVGNGYLIGNGSAWWGWKHLQGPAATELYQSQANNLPVEKRIYGTEKAALRPSFIQTINCKNVHMEGFTVVDGPQWTLHPVYCENVLIQNITIKTNGHNTDGINPDSCKNVVIENCTFSTGDDCIAINSGMNEDGWRVGKPCENIIIRNCTMKKGHGAIVIGSGMSGGVRNVYASNNIVLGGMWGIRLKSMRGRGGYIRDIWIEDVEINNVSRAAIQISMFYDTTTVKPLNDTPADFSNIYFKNIFGQNNTATVEIRGLPEHNLQDITLENINFSPTNIMEIEDVKKLRIIYNKEFESPLLHCRASSLTLQNTKDLPDACL